MAPGEGTPEQPARATADFLSPACITVLLLSLVKNVGFGFPSADLVESISLETSRLFYAAGLLAAGLITDMDRKYARSAASPRSWFPSASSRFQASPSRALSSGPSTTCSTASPRCIAWRCSAISPRIPAANTSRVSDLHSGALATPWARHSGLPRAQASWPSWRWLPCCSPRRSSRSTTCSFCLYPARPAPQRTSEQRFEEFAAAFGISVREREVLRLVLAEHTNAEVAAELFITEGTVKYHVHNLFKKTGCTTRRELIAKLNGK